MNSDPTDVALAPKASALIGLICFVRFATYASTNSPPFAFGSSLLSSLSRGGTNMPIYTMI
ncbi:MAG: hypothetical protein CL920_01025 [Deltaproteobacteria bacterium]|nr:hypothetical protein [Deltaproteobacteria bacterium]